jgi:polysaccharide deacetylase 2 family uncharacterized protein YibQ
MKLFKRLKGFPFPAVFIGALLVAAAFLFWERWDDQAMNRTATPERPTATSRAGGLKAETPAGERRAGERIAVIIDDIGFDLTLVKELAKIKAPIACAVLPYAPHAAEAAVLLHAAGKEILLHLPMEPLAYPAEDPGTGALFVDMNANELRGRMDTALAAVPHVRGVNNHMGSRFMRDEAGVAGVMDELARRGLFFVDSRTAPDSRGREGAALAGIRFAARDLFIDHAPGYEAALTALIHPPGQDLGRREWLLIGHPHPETLRALREALPRWRKEGIRVIPVSACVRIPRVKADAGGPRQEPVSSLNIQGRKPVT